MIEDLKNRGISLDEKAFRSCLGIALVLFIVEDVEARRNSGYSTVTDLARFLGLSGSIPLPMLT